jgi:hypothetical protein
MIALNTKKGKKKRFGCVRVAELIEEEQRAWN